jgi:hypothetical protein
MVIRHCPFRVISGVYMQAGWNRRCLRHIKKNSTLSNNETKSNFQGHWILARWKPGNLVPQVEKLCPPDLPLVYNLDLLNIWWVSANTNQQCQLGSMILEGLTIDDSEQSDLSRKFSLGDRTRCIAGLHWGRNLIRLLMRTLKCNT